MSNRNPFLWPAGSRIAFYTGRGKRIDESRNRRLDLADTLMLHWKRSSRTLYLGLALNTSNPKFWDEITLKSIEARIRYDLTSDGYRVSITRVTQWSIRSKQSSASEFRWKLAIRSLF